MDRRRILHVVPSLDQSGAEKQLALAALHLPRDAFDVNVLAVARGGHYEHGLRDAGIPVHVLSKRLKWDPFALGRIVAHIRSLKPDIVHTWMFGGNSYGRVAARWVGGTRVVASERCVDEWKSGYHFAIDRFLMRCTDRVVVNANAIGRFYAQHGVDAERIVTIANAIESRERPDKEDAIRVKEGWGISASTPVIGFIGRLWPQKRVQDLIWAADILRMSGWNFRVVIIGDGPRRSALTRFAEGIEIEPIVQFLGHRADAAQLLAGIDILALPSQFEGMPNVVLEAMMAGKPVVATRIAGVDEVVVDGETGILVNPKQPLELARGIRELLSDPSRATRMGDAGRQRVLTEFSIAKMVAGYVRLYGELMAVPAR